MLRRIAMGSGPAWLAMLGSLLLLGAGCASVKVTERDEYRGEKLARPNRIFVHDFAATPDDLPAWSDAGKEHAGQQAAASPKEIAIGRELGVHMAAELVKRIDKMGLDAVRATQNSRPANGDIVIVGYLNSIDEGSGFKRVVIGFGSGTAEIMSQVEGYVWTDYGYRKLGSGTADSTGGKTPGAVLPLIVTIATANPLGLIVMAPIKIGSEMTGRSTAEGVGKRMADTIADDFEKNFFHNQGWLDNR
jgi:hypothetical protein